MRVISFEDVALEREGRAVFDGLTLTLSEPRIGLIGRNGSGKSTALRLMAGLVAPGRGRVRVNGVDPARDRTAALSTVGILFQNPDHQIIFPAVLEELCFGLEQQGLGRAEARAAAQATLARFGRTDWAERLCHTLSQGQRQLVCLMAVLAMEPDWLLCDEPFNSLDLPTAMQIEARIAEARQGVVLVTHDPARLAAFDRVIWLEAGAVAADGPPATVLPAYIAEMERIAREEPC